MAGAEGAAGATDIGSGVNFGFSRKGAGAGADGASPGGGFFATAESRGRVGVDFGAVVTGFGSGDKAVGAGAALGLAPEARAVEGASAARSTAGGRSGAGASAASWGFIRSRGRLKAELGETGAATSPELGASVSGVGSLETTGLKGDLDATPELAESARGFRRSGAGRDSELMKKTKQVNPGPETQKIHSPCKPSVITFLSQNSYETTLVFRAFVGSSRPNGLLPFKKKSKTERESGHRSRHG